MTNELKVLISPQQQPAVLIKKQQQSPSGNSAELVSTQALNHTEKTELEKSSDARSLTENDRENLQEKVSQLNDHMQNLNRNLQFKVDEQSGDTVVTVIDSATEEVVRQIPSEEVLEIRHAIEKFRGMLFETKA